MKIESSADKTLDNGAVLSHIRGLVAEKGKKDARKSKKNANEPAKDGPDWVLNKVNDYFQTARAAERLPDYEAFPSDHMQILMSRLRKFDLVKSEMLMLLNLKPDDPAFLDCIIEELDYRHPEADDQNEILEIIHAALGNDSAMAVDGVDASSAPKASDKVDEGT